MATVTTICDRLHEINASLSYGGSASRWFVNLDSARLPLAIPIWRQVLQAQRFGESWHMQRVFEIVLYCEYATTGIPSKTAQQAAETAIETLTDAYIARPRLKYSSSDLSDVQQVAVQQDSGLEVVDGLFQVRLPLAITYIKTVALV